MRRTAGQAGCVEIIHLQARLQPVETSSMNIGSSAPLDFDIPEGNGAGVDTAGDLRELANGVHCVCKLIPGAVRLKISPFSVLPAMLLRTKIGFMIALLCRARNWISWKNKYDVTFLTLVIVLGNRLNVMLMTA